MTGWACADRHPEADRSNHERIIRLFGQFVGAGFAGYFLVLLPSIMAFEPRAALWWTVLAVASIFGSGLALGTASRFADLRRVKAMGNAAPVAFLISIVTWPAAWDGSHVRPPEGVWIAAFPGMGALVALVAWPLTAVAIYVVVSCFGVQLINYAARGLTDPTVLVPETLFAIMFCTIFIGGSVMALRTGRLLDETTDEAHAAVAAAAAQEARAVERDRFAALTHDSVMATLLAAARGAPSGMVVDLAATTLAELDAIGSDEDDRPFGPVHAVIHFRAAASEADVHAAFDVAAQPNQEHAPPIPAEVVRAIGGALAEALRNSARHAGPHARTAVRGTVSGDRVDLEVRDDGVGFDSAAVPPQRLGIAVSIQGRMNRVAGGQATVASTPGAGTVVRLGWART